MPTVRKERGFRFFFYSNEGNPAEPAHVHVIKGGAEAKLWLEPEVAIAETNGFNPSELRSILKIATDHRKRFTEAWHEHFGN